LVRSAALVSCEISDGPRAGALVLNVAVAARSGPANPSKVAERAHAQTQVFEQFSDFPGHDFGQRGESNECVFIDREVLRLRFAPAARENCGRVPRISVPG